MARYDKYDGKVGGFREALAVAWTSADVGKIFGVSRNSSGLIVKGGADAAAIIGVVIVNRAMQANEIVDVMFAGEIADFTTLDDGATATIAGTKYYAAFATGIITATATNNKLIGQLGQKDGRDRLNVRVALA